jgi:hypothetical protein
VSAIHRLRVDTIEHMKQFLKQKRKVTKTDFVYELMTCYQYSRATAYRYVEDMTVLGIAKNNGDTLEYIFDAKASK